MNQESQDPLATLEEELNTWRKTSFDRLLVRRDPLPALRRAAQRAGYEGSGGQWQDQVRAFLSAVVAAHDRSTGALADVHATISNPDVVREIFGLAVKSKNASVVVRQERAGLMGGVSGHTLRKDLHAFVHQLAIWIHTYLDESSPPPDRATSPASIRTIIPREEDLGWLCDTYKILQEQRGGVFQLWGIAGVGKTTLARLFADRIGPEYTVGVVRVGRRGLYENDVRLIVRREGIDDSGLSNADCLTAFWNLVMTYRRMRPTRLLIFDGVEIPAQVIELMPLGIAIPTLLTTRQCLNFPDEDVPQQLKATPARQLMTFTRNQSVQLVRRYVPNLDENIAAKFAKVLDGHPESLMHVAHCLMLPDVNPSDLLEEISRRPRDTLIAMMHALDVPDCSAHAIEKLLRKLDPGSLAYTILACVIWAEESGQLPWSFVLELVTMLQGERPGLLAVRGALKQLENLGLLRHTHDSLRVSRLTCQVLRDLTLDQSAPVLVAYEQLVAAEPNNPEEEDLLTLLRLEYGFARPLQGTLKEHLPSCQSPVLICIDQSNWVLLYSDRQGVRRVIVYRVTPGAILRLDTSTEREWQMFDSRIEGIIGFTERYYELVSDGWRKFLPADRWQRIKKRLQPITGTAGC